MDKVFDLKQEYGMQEKDLGPVGVSCVFSWGYRC